MPEARTDQSGALRNIPTSKMTWCDTKSRIPHSVKQLGTFEAYGSFRPQQLACVAVALCFLRASISSTRIPRPGGSGWEAPPSGSEATSRLRLELALERTFGHTRLWSSWPLCWRSGSERSLPLICARTPHVPPTTPRTSELQSPPGFCESKVTECLRSNFQQVLHG